jgi:hypothetical protein
MNTLKKENFKKKDERLNMMKMEERLYMPIRMLKMLI